MDIYQGGTAYQVYSPQGSKPLDSLKIAGSVRKEYDKASKSQVVVVEQATSKITVPKTSTGALLLHPIVVVQLFAAAGAATALGGGLSIEFTVVDALGKRRLMFSNSFSAIQPNPQHTKFPLQGLPRGVWVDLIFDVRQLHRGVYETRAPVGFRGVENITLSGANCRVRRIYTLRELPPTVGAYHMHVPSQFTLPSDVDQTQILISRGDELMAAPAPSKIPNAGAAQLDAPPLAAGGQQGKPVAVRRSKPQPQHPASGLPSAERRHVDASMDVVPPAASDDATAAVHQQRTLHPLGTKRVLGSSVSSRLGSSAGRGSGVASGSMRLRQQLLDAEDPNIVRFDAHPVLQALHEEKMEAAHSSNQSSAAHLDVPVNQRGAQQGFSAVQEEHPSVWLRTSIPTEVPRRSYLGLVASPHPYHDGAVGSASEGERAPSRDIQAQGHAVEDDDGGYSDDEDDDETFVVRHNRQLTAESSSSHVYDEGRHRHQNHDDAVVAASVGRNSASDDVVDLQPPSIEGSHRNHRNLRASPSSRGSTLSRPEPLSASLGSGGSSRVSIDPSAYQEAYGGDDAAIDASTARQLRMSESTVLIGGDTFDTRNDNDNDMSTALARAVRAAAQRALQSMPPTMPNVAHNNIGGRPSTDGAARKKKTTTSQQTQQQHPATTRDVAMSMDDHRSAHHSHHHQPHFRSDVSPPSTASGGDRYSAALLSDEEDCAVMCVDPHAFYYPSQQQQQQPEESIARDGGSLGAALGAVAINDANSAVGLSSPLPNRLVADELAQRAAMIEDAAAQPWVAPPSRRGPSPSPLSPPPPVRISHDLGSSPPHPQALADSSRYEYDPIVGCYFDRVTNRFVKPPHSVVAAAPASPTGTHHHHHQVPPVYQASGVSEVRGLSPGQAHRPPSKTHA